MPKIPKLRDINAARLRPPVEPVWKGPQDEGVSQSLLSYYLICKERFRVHTIDGITTEDEFNVAIEFGQMWHECEEALSNSHRDGDGESVWLQRLTDYSARLANKYRSQQSQVLKWYNVVRVLFPIYVNYWKSEGDMSGKHPLLQEQVFAVGYRLPSGRVVKLRGKFDAVDYLEGEGLYLQENKTKSTIDVHSIERQLTNDLQVMTYLVALREYVNTYRLIAGAINHGAPNPTPIKGVRYNVVRRPLAGGKGSIRPRKGSKNVAAESMDEFYDRLSGVIKEDVDDYFRRWKVSISSDDIQKFERETLIPVLENLCDDYEWWSHCKLKGSDPFDDNERMNWFPVHFPRHYRLPYGIYNIVTRGGFDDLDDYINTGSKIGLTVADTFFPELENDA